MKEGDEKILKREIKTQGKVVQCWYSTVQYSTYVRAGVVQKLFVTHYVVTEIYSFPPAPPPSLSLTHKHTHRAHAHARTHCISVSVLLVIFQDVLRKKLSEHAVVRQCHVTFEWFRLTSLFGSGCTVVSYRSVGSWKVPS